MNRGWAKYSRLTEMKRRPFYQKGRYFWLSIFLGLVPFLLFRFMVFYDVMFPIGLQRCADSTLQLSNDTHLELGLSGLRDQSNVQDAETGWIKEDKEFVQILQENQGREFQSIESDAEEDKEKQDHEQFSNEMDELAVQIEQVAGSATEREKIGQKSEVKIHTDLEGKQQLIEKEGKGGLDLDSKLRELTEGDQEKFVEEHAGQTEEELESTMKEKDEEENKKLKEEQLSKVKEDEEEISGEGQTWREEEVQRMEEKNRSMDYEESESKVDEEAAAFLKEQEKEAEQLLINEVESKNNLGVATKDTVYALQNQGLNESMSDTTEDKGLEVVEQQSHQGPDLNPIVEVTSGTDSKMMENGGATEMIETKEDLLQLTEQTKLSNEDMKPADNPDQKQEEEHHVKHEKDQEEDKKVIHVVSPRDEELNKQLGHCNLYDGDWEYDEMGPLYTNETCPYLQDDQNCLANGRPDRMYLHWRWKPRHCDLPRFDAKGFLQAVKGKTVGFVGDSLARNQLQSLLCMLYQVEQPIVLYDGDDSVKYNFEEHNVNLLVIWAPYLVKFSHTFMREYELDSVIDMDDLQVSWTARLKEMDIITISVGQWFFRSSLYVRNNGTDILGCYRCEHLKNITDIGFMDIFRESWRMGLERILLEQNKTVIITTFAVQHYEHGEWNKGWCRREKPITMEEAPGFGWLNEEMRGIVLDEFTKVLDSRNQGDNKLFFDFIDTTKVNLLRADGHPGPYRRPFPYAHMDPSEWVLNDCLHWCMPGPVDTWNQILYKILERYP